MDEEINNFIKKNTKKQYRKKGTNTKKNTKKQTGGNANIGKIIQEDKFAPLKFTDNILLFANENTSSPIINSKELDKYVVSVSSSGTVYITLNPKKMNITYEEYKKQKEATKEVKK
jgi:hypothetical protein